MAASTYSRPDDGNKRRRKKKAEARRRGSGLIACSAARLVLVTAPGTAALRLNQVTAHSLWTSSAAHTRPRQGLGWRASKRGKRRLAIHPWLTSFTRSFIYQEALAELAESGESLALMTLKLRVVVGRQKQRR